MDGARGADPEQPGDAHHEAGLEYVNPPAQAEPGQFDPTILSGLLASPADAELVVTEHALARSGEVGGYAETMVPSRDLPVYEEVVPQDDVRRDDGHRPVSNMPAPTRVHVPARSLPAPLPSPVENETLTAILGSVKREGAWVPSRHTTLNVVMGDAKLDFTTAAALPEEVTVRVQVLMGDCTLKVPAEAEVVMQGTPIMADLKEVTKHRKRRKLRRMLGDPAAAPRPTSAAPSAPTMRLIVTGVVIMGDVKVERVLDS